MGFLPEGTTVPTSADNYTKLETGDNKFRLFGKPLMGWECWIKVKEGPRPIRREREDQLPSKGDRPSSFWAFVVYNYKLKKFQVLSIKQKTIMRQLVALEEDEDWGDLREYDINIKKTGEARETKYQVLPLPKKKVAKDIKDEYDGLKINMDLYMSSEDKPYGGHPFIESQEQDEEEVVDPDDLPF